MRIRTPTLSTGTTYGWVVLSDWDFTTGTPQSGLGSNGTYTLALAGGYNVALTTSNIVGSATPSTTASLGANGLDLSVSRASGTGGASATFALDLGTFLSSDPDLNNNLCCLEIIAEPVSQPTTLDTFGVDIGDDKSLTVANPSMFAGLQRAAGPLFKILCGNRQTTNTVGSSGASQGSILPASFHAQIIGTGYSWQVRADAGTVVADPWSPTTYKGSCGLYASKTPTDVALNVWGLPWVVISLTTNAASAQQFRVKRIRFLRMTPTGS